MVSKNGLLGLSLVVFSVLFGTGPLGVSTARADTGNDSQIETDVHKALDNKRFHNVTAAVHDSNVTLSGTVDVYAEKEDLDRRIHHVKRVKGVENAVEVATAPVDDAALRDKLAKQLSYDRVGYGTTAFNSISIGVHNGVVTLTGTVYGPPDKDSALSLVGNSAGVKDIVDELQVAPVSAMDDRLRLQLARQIYGNSTLQKYALDPAKPIRITVVNGRVTLSGVVDNKMDRDVAGLQANTVSGIFHVTNNLQIAGQQQAEK